MSGQLTYPPSRVPPLSMVITTYELRGEEGRPPLVATVTHTFYGDTDEELRNIMQAHSKTDQFFAGSLVGVWNGIILRNSEPVILKTGGMAL